MHHRIALISAQLHTIAYLLCFPLTTKRHSWAHRHILQSFPV